MADRRSAVRWELDAEGIVTVVLDDPGRTANMVNQRHHDGFGACLDEVEARRDEVRGIVLTSAKRSFFSGQDVEIGEIPLDELAATYGFVVPVRDQLRRLETLGIPVAAAMTGSALGGGLELGLACHHRVGLDAPDVFWGLAEVAMGLMPGCGGLVRTTRMLGIAAVVEQVVGPAAVLGPAEAVRAGIVDELASTREECVARARAWVHARRADGDQDFTQRWDRPGYRVPGPTPGTREFDTLVRRLEADLDARPESALEPARRAVLAAAVEIARVDPDTAFAVETKHFFELFDGPRRMNLSRAMVDPKAVADGVARPGGHARWTPARVAVLGDTATAADLAERCARAGWPVVRTVDADHDVVLDATAGTMVIGSTRIGLRLRHPTQRPPLLALYFARSAPLVELSCPDGTPDAVVAKAFDVAIGLAGIPLLVRGCQGSFVGRVVDAVTAERAALLDEGVPEREVRLALARAGFAAPALSTKDPVVAQVDRGEGDSAVDLRDAVERLTMVAAVAARRAVADGSAVTEAEANIGSIVGAGFPIWTGGAAQYVAAYPGGAAAFLARADELAARHGDRFRCA